MGPETSLRTIEIPEADRREIRSLLEPAVERLVRDGRALIPEGGIGVVYIDPPGVCVPVST